MTLQSLPDLTLAQMLRERARSTPERVAIRQKDFGVWKPLTWASYYQRASHFGLGLHTLGMGAGGHVGVLSENRTEWVLAQMGAALIGAVAVGVYPTSPSTEVAYVVEHADVQIIVCEDQEQTDKVLQARSRLPHLRKIVVIETKGLRSFTPEERQFIVTFDEVEKAGAALGSNAVIDSALAGQQLSDIGLMIYTSGSTGAPKGAMISWRNMRAVVPGIVERMGLTEDTTHLSYLPLCHVAEQMLTTFVPIYIGAQVHFGESIRTVQEDLREIAPTMFLGVPRIWEKMHATISIKLQEAGGLRLRLFNKAYAACLPLAEKPRSSWTTAEKLTYFASYWSVFRALQNFIGLRKAQVALTGAAPIAPDVVRFFRTLGVEHRLADTGELLLRGDIVFEGYYKNPEATAQSIQDGWLHTGDVVREEHGQFKIVDRLKDIMITAGGKNLTPSEIENTMKGSPYIKECVIVAEGRKFVGALVMIDYDTVAQWAEAQRITFTHFRSLVELPQVRALIEAEIARGNERLAQVSQIRKFHLLTKELDHDDGEVTATMKVRRSSIYKTYANEIEALYR